LAADRNGFRRSYCSLRCFLVLAVGQRHIPTGNHHAVRVDRGNCDTPSDAPTSRRSKELDGDREDRTGGTAASASYVYGRKPISEPEIGREMERQSGQR
jgi:hypothetical protein